MKTSAHISLLLIVISSLSVFGQNDEPLAKLSDESGKITVLLHGEWNAEDIEMTEETRGKKDFRINAVRKPTKLEKWYDKGKDFNYYYHAENNDYEWLIRFIKNSDNDVKIIKKSLVSGKVVNTYDGKFYAQITDAFTKLAEVKSSDSKASLDLIGSIDSTSVRVSGTDRFGNYVSAVCFKRNAEAKTWYKQSPSRYYSFFYEKGEGTYHWEIRFLRHKQHNVEVIQKAMGNYKEVDRFTGICDELHQINMSPTN